MSFSLSTIERENRLRIDRYWEKHKKQLYDQKNKQNKIANIVQNSPGAIDWEGENCGGNGSRKKQAIESSQLVYSMSSSIPLNLATGMKKQSLNSLINSIQISEIQSPDLKNLCSIQGSLDQSKQQLVQPILLQSAHNTKWKLELSQNSSKILVKYADSFSEKAISELVNHSTNSHQMGSSLAQGEYKSADVTKDINVSNKLTDHGDRTVQVGDFGGDEITEGSMFGRTHNSTHHLSKNVARDSLSRYCNPISSKLHHQKHHSHHPVCQQVSEDNINIIDIPIFNRPPKHTHQIHTFGQLPPKVQNSSPINKIVRIGQLLEMQRNSRKKISYPKFTPQKYQSEPKTKSEYKSTNKASSHTIKKIKIKVMSVENNEERILKKFVSLTDVYDHELNKKKRDVQASAEKVRPCQQKVLTRSSELVQIGFCQSCPFKIDKPCIDTAAKKHRNFET